MKSTKNILGKKEKVMVLKRRFQRKMKKMELPVEMMAKKVMEKFINIENEENNLMKKTKMWMKKVV